MRRRKAPRVIDCADCGVTITVVNGVQRYCPGCQYLHARLIHGRKHCSPINCADCGESIVTGNIFQTRCKPCQYKLQRARQDARMRAGGHKRAYQTLRNNPVRWQRKRAQNRKAYQELVRDTVRYADYLAGKREWYRQRQIVLRRLEIDPSAIERAVIAMVERDNDAA